MNVEIINKPLVLNIHGFSGTTINQDYTGTAFKLMDKMWQIVKSNDLKNKGLNIWVYEANENIFAGVELDVIPKPGLGLEQKIVTLKNYAYCKHIGPYQLIKQTGISMKNELMRKGFETGSLYVEIYGHWKNDQTSLETELLMLLR